MVRFSGNLENMQIIDLMITFYKTGVRHGVTVEVSRQSSSQVT